MRRRAWPLLLALTFAGCLEQPKPKPLARTPSLYTRLGGEAVLTRVVDDYVTRLEEAKLLESGEDLERQKHRMVQQLGAATGGPQRPGGKGLWELFSGVTLRKDSDFDAALQALDRALEDNGVGPRDRGAVKALLLPLRQERVRQAE
jgi:truncated hemoglobin YjbI